MICDKKEKMMNNILLIPIEIDKQNGKVHHCISNLHHIFLLFSELNLFVFQLTASYRQKAFTLMVYRTAKMSMCNSTENCNRL